MRKKLLSFISVVCIGVLPALALAQVVSVKSSKSSYTAGDSFSVSLGIDTKGKSINTISGSIVVPTDLFQIIDVRSGSSIISLWVERPTTSAFGDVISFTGGIPGGFNGSNGPILSFGLKAKKAGTGKITLQDLKVLLNDGAGTEIASTLLPLALTIEKVSTKAGIEEKPRVMYQPPADVVPPESFIPLISQHPDIANNKYFVSFFAVDKDSGISHYEVREELLWLPFFGTRFSTNWIKTESPYILHYQLWRTKVLVRAYDNAGNMTEGYAIKPFDPIVIWIFFITVLLLLFGARHLNQWVQKRGTYSVPIHSSKKRS